MPHSTSSDPSGRDASLSRSSSLKGHREANGEINTGVERFPDFDPGSNGRPASPRKHEGSNNGSAYPAGRWQPRRDSRVRWAPNDQSSHILDHSRHRRLSNAIRHVRSGSMSQNAHEIAGALRAPISYRLIVRPSRPIHSFVKIRRQLLMRHVCW